MDKPVKKRPKLYIVNLQWTPKDDHSTLKINGKCDTVIEKMMAHLGLSVPKYVRDLDPIFYHATHLHELELHTTTRSPIEKIPKQSDSQDDSKNGEIKTSENQAIEQKEASLDNTSHSVCSSTQDISSNVVSDIITCDVAIDDARASDFLNPSLLLVSAEIKEEIVSDEENYIDERKQNSNVKKEHDEATDSDSDIKGQSNLSVINEKLEIIVPDVVSTNETQIAIKIESVEESLDTVVQTNLITQESPVASSVDVFEGMHFLFGRNLWSDLSLFDAFTHQPLLLNHSVYGWSGLNSFSSLVPYFDNQTRPNDFNSSITHTSPIDDKPAANQSECSTSSSAKSYPLRNKAEKSTVAEIGCDFCLKFYKSKRCLFYVMSPSNASFTSESVCLCCGGDDDEDDQDDDDNSNDKTPAKVLNINPGWFGKGYRKKVKKR
ncbi:uncharacterized protein LOC135844046 [Planococcus citri]|uniref:uncharacterized protein LOC135844046 n=1 Tax=Planococcus citri TaxID=170843 RepID=UPI0031F943A8